jgi:comEA protein
MVLVFCFILAFGQVGFSAQKQAGNPVLININTASVQQLSTLPRIGDKIARRIVDFRKKNGKFKRVEDLMKVSGVGEKVFIKLKERITV